MYSLDKALYRSLVVFFIQECAFLITWIHFSELSILYFLNLKIESFKINSIQITYWEEGAGCSL